MSKKKKREYREVIELIGKIEKAAGNRKCIFRGEPSDQFGKITSNLYRKLGEPEVVLDVMEQLEKTKKLIADDFVRFVAQFGEGKRKEPPEEGEFGQKDELGKILEKFLFIGRRGGAVPEKYRGAIVRELHKTYAIGAKDWEGDSSKSEIDILADIQHYGGETNYIDFSECHLVALFFACYDYNYGERDGHIIILPKQGLERKSNEGLISQKERFIFSPPSDDNRRVEKQHSVMLYEPQGFLEYEQLEIKPVKVRQELKRDVLAYLSTRHKISVKTLFPDVHGYIKSQKFVRRSRSLHRQAYILLEERKYEEALAVCNRALELNPESSEFYALRAQAYWGLGAYGPADLDMNRALERNDKNPLAYFARAGIRIGQCRLEEALKDCELILKLGYEEAGVYQLRSRVYDALFCYEEALKDCNHALGLGPQSDIFCASMYDARSRALTGLRRYGEALSDSNTGLNLCGQNTGMRAVLYNARALAHLGLEDYKKALEDSNRGLELDNWSDSPLCVALYKTRAMVYKGLGCYDEALKDCARGLELANGNALFLTGFYLLRSDIYEESDKKEVNLKKALELAKETNHIPYIELIQQELAKLKPPDPNSTLILVQ